MLSPIYTMIFILSFYIFDFYVKLCKAEPIAFIKIDAYYLIRMSSAVLLLRIQSFNVREQKYWIFLLQNLLSLIPLSHLNLPYIICLWLFTSQKNSEMSVHFDLRKTKVLQQIVYFGRNRRKRLLCTRTLVPVDNNTIQNNNIIKMMS